MEKKKKFYDKQRNRFMKLRYKSDNDLYDEITAKELAKEFEISPGVISKLESNDLTEDAALGVHSSVYKKYHEKFNCSYEYLFNEVPLKEEKFKYITQDSILGKFDDFTVNNLNKMINESDEHILNRNMFMAFLANPDELEEFFTKFIKYMYILHLDYSNNPYNSDDEFRANIWSNLYEHFGNYCLNTLMPNLQYYFRNNIENKDYEKIYEDYKKNTNDSINVTIKSVKAVDTND